MLYGTFFPILQMTPVPNSNQSTSSTTDNPEHNIGYMLLLLLPYRNWDYHQQPQQTEGRLLVMFSVTQYTAITKAFLTFKMAHASGCPHKCNST